MFSPNGICDCCREFSINLDNNKLCPGCNKHKHEQLSVMELLCRVCKKEESVVWDEQDVMCVNCWNTRYPDRKLEEV